MPYAQVLTTASLAGAATALLENGKVLSADGYNNTENNNREGIQK